MNLYFRVLIVILLACFRPRIAALTAPQRIRLRVYPNDLDINSHMNNGRYLTVMDLGRLDLILRSGLWRLMRVKKYGPVLGSAQMRFRLPLLPFQLFDLETRVLGWDDKWIFMEQRFLHVKGPKAGAVAAIGLIKGGLYDPIRKTTVPNAEILAALGQDKQSPPFPDYLQDWINAEDSLRAVTT